MICLKTVSGEEADDSISEIDNTKNDQSGSEGDILEFSDEGSMDLESWCCFDVEHDGPHGSYEERVLLLENKPSDNTVSIGDTIERTINGISLVGKVICNSEMGITALDLFNEIINTENDLKKFLTQNNIKPSHQLPGMIIQG